MTALKGGQEITVHVQQLPAQEEVMIRYAVGVDHVCVVSVCVTNPTPHTLVCPCHWYSVLPVSVTTSCVIKDSTAWCVVDKEHASALIVSIPAPATTQTSQDISMRELLASAAMTIV